MILKANVYAYTQHIHVGCRLTKAKMENGNTIRWFDPV